MAKSRKRKQAVRKEPEGQIRQSQMITTYGPGSMVDLVDRAVVIGGLEHWSFGKQGFEALDDPRLRRALVPILKSLDENLDLAAENYFRMAPAGDAREPSLLVGVRALEFPRWFVCQNCRRLARATDGFEVNKKGRYLHICENNKKSHAVPVRFVAACSNGHLEDFPWVAFAHEDKICGAPKLFLLEGATGDVARIIVKCRNCDQPGRSLAKAAVLPFGCNGRRPWLGGRAVEEPCDKNLKLMVRTASDAYFAQMVSALRLPEPGPSPLSLAVREKDIWEILQHVTGIDQLRTFATLPKIKSAIAGHSYERVLATIEAERSADQNPHSEPLRTAEYRRLTSAPQEVPGVLAPEGVQFAAYEIPKSRADLPPEVARLVIVPELREVRVQISFTRFASVSANLQMEYNYRGATIQPAVLTLPTGNEKWLPAAEVRGEGLFFELDHETVVAWEERPAVQERAEILQQAFTADGGKGEFLGVRFYLLHSLSHLLLTAISLECGYAASSIRERIYCEPSTSATRGMAGILLSTGTTGSEGTLGGLVEEGRRLRHHLREAWDLGRLCSNDPVCATHNPATSTDDRRLEGAACHGCLYVAECSCERFNRYLDRALVVPTIGNDPELAFFRERP